MTELQSTLFFIFNGSFINILNTFSRKGAKTARVRFIRDKSYFLINIELFELLDLTRKRGLKRKNLFRNLPEEVQ